MAVIGLGAAGAATVAALADRGVRVLGLDRHTPPHALGSTHGETRMIREAYFEAPFYVPLVQRAFDGWRRLEERARRRLLNSTGGIMIGLPDGELVTGSRRSARAHGLPYEELDAAEIRRRFPALRPDDEFIGILEPRAGFLRPEACVEAFLDLAREDGADLRTGEPVLGWSAEDGEVRLRTPAGEHRAAGAVFCVGAWTGGLFPDVEPTLEVARAVQYWFAAEREDSLRPGRCPVYAWEPEPDRIWYGFPLQPRGVKVGFHYGGEGVADPDAVRRSVGRDEVDEMRAMLRRSLPGAAGPLREASVCLYTNTPDHHFLLDRHPDARNVVIASACSGHGFKFVSALGPMLADLALDEDPGFDLGPFRLDRFEEEDRRPDGPVAPAGDGEDGEEPR